jgi:hypothetical protein
LIKKALGSTATASQQSAIQDAEIYLQTEPGQAAYGAKAAGL